MKKLSFLVALFAVSTFFLTSVSAQPCCPHKGKEHYEKQQGKGHGGHKNWAELNLTEDQKTELKKLREQYHAKFKGTKGELWELHKKWKEEIVKVNPDRDLLSQYSKEIGEFHAKKSEEKVEHMLQVKQILTPEQFEQMINKKMHCRQGKKGYKGKCPAMKGCPRDKKGDTKEEGAEI